MQRRSQEGVARRLGTDIVVFVWVRAYRFEDPNEIGVHRSRDGGHVSEDLFGRHVRNSALGSLLINLFEAHPLAVMSNARNQPFTLHFHIPRFCPATC